MAPKNSRMHFASYLVQTYNINFLLPTSMVSSVTANEAHIRKELSYAGCLEVL